MFSNKKIGEGSASERGNRRRETFNGRSTTRGEKRGRRKPQNKKVVGSCRIVQKKKKKQQKLKGPANGFQAKGGKAKETRGDETGAGHKQETGTWDAYLMITEGDLVGKTLVNEERRPARVKSKGFVGYIRNLGAMGNVSEERESNRKKTAAPTNHECLQLGKRNETTKKLLD